ncbi:MAG: TrkA family potassium uptake protein [Bacteroidales bacterium]|nr:TrkA family potassium uptake protein [Bacteroidales bacterium]
MKYVVIGLGLFGSKCAENLTAMGHEVLGIDNDPDILEEYKESFTSVMRMDTTSVNAMKTLPLDDIDAVIVAIGEDVGASILTLSILKNMGVKRIIGRAISETHHNILKHIGITEVVLPLEDSASHLASVLQLKGVLSFTELSSDHAIAQIPVPESYIGHLTSSLELEERFRLKIIAVKRAPATGMLGSLYNKNYTVDLLIGKETELVASDVLVLAGKVTAIKKFIGR